jgi:hypothetical protein
MPQRSERGVSVRYETTVLPLLDRKAWAEVAHALTYENCLVTGTAVLAEFPVLRQQAVLKNW